MNPLYQYASAEATGEKPGLFASLGIDVTMLVMQSVAFLALLWLLSKYVYPILLRMLDERDAKLAAGQIAAQEAVKAAEQAEASTAKQLAQAKKDAAAIIETAHKEAAQMVEDAQARSTQKADHILEQAKAQIDSDIAEARTKLRGEMTDLVAHATEKIIGQKIDAKTDAALIRRALEESK